MMMNAKIEIFDDLEALSSHFAGFLLQKVNQIPARASFAIALSGGSTPKSIFQVLSTHYADKMAWEKMKVFWGDERCVGPDHPESNYLTANHLLLDKVAVAHDRIFRIRGEAGPEKEAMRYSRLVSGEVSQEKQIPGFDLFMLGLGEDGHTASIFPPQLHLFNESRLFAATENPTTGQKRITATGKLINHSRLVVFLVTGESKAEVLAQVINRTGDWQTFPASYVAPVNGELIFLLDKAAASRL